MCSSLIIPSSLTFSPNSHFIYRQDFIFPSYPFLLRPKTPKFSLSASVTEKNAEVSWGFSDPNAFDEFNGWDFVEPPVIKKKKQQKGYFFNYNCLKCFYFLSLENIQKILLLFYFYFYCCFIVDIIGVR